MHSLHATTKPDEQMNDEARNRHAQEPSKEILALTNIHKNYQNKGPIGFEWNIEKVQPARHNRADQKTKTKRNRVRTEKKRIAMERRGQERLEGTQRSNELERLIRKSKDAPLPNKSQSTRSFTQ